MLRWKGRVLRNDEPVPTPLHVTHEQRDCTGEGAGIDRSNTVMGQVPMEAGVGKIPQSRNAMGANPTAKRNHTFLCFYSSSFVPMVEVVRARRTRTYWRSKYAKGLDLLDRSTAYCEILLIKALIDSKLRLSWYSRCLLVFSGDDTKMTISPEILSTQGWLKALTSAKEAA
jgi:hypothetical protein